MRISVVLLTLAAAGAAAEDASVGFGGHTKARLVARTFGDDSLFREVAGPTVVDVAGELRLSLAAGAGRWSMQGDYQLFAANSEFLPAGLPDDADRRFDLSADLHQGSRSAVVHRLDRFWVGYTGEKTTVRIGRQALSWGNGLFYSPLDLVNPFEPTTIDTEYKTGDDMLYAQYLRDNGDDVQAAVVVRRDPVTGNAGRNEITVALKYHGFAGETEYDLLVADDRNDAVIGAGAVRSMGGAVVRADLVVSDRGDGTVVEALANVSYSWIWNDRNVSAAAEYYHDGDRGHYLAGSLLVEMTPLWTLTPTLLSRVDEPSGLLQLVTQYSLADNLSFLGSLNVPLGANGTEYGGPESGVPNRYLSFESGVFAQLAWYF